MLTRISPALKTDIAHVRAMFKELIEQGRAELAQSGFEGNRCAFTATLDMRYAGQSFELPVPVPQDVTDTDAIIKSFGEIYTARYGGTTPAVVEIVNYRIAAWGLTDKPELPRLTNNGRSAKLSTVGMREVIIEGERNSIDVIDRARMPIDRQIAGPVLIEESGSSTFIPPGWSAALESFDCIILNRA